MRRPGSRSRARAAVRGEQGRELDLAPASVSEDGMRSRPGTAVGTMSSLRRLSRRSRRRSSAQPVPVDPEPAGVALRVEVDDEDRSPASAIGRELTTVVVFPTPPFWLAQAIVWPIRPRCGGAHKSEFTIRAVPASADLGRTRARRYWRRPGGGSRPGGSSIRHRSAALRTGQLIRVVVDPGSRSSCCPAGNEPGSRPAGHVPDGRHRGLLPAAQRRSRWLRMAVGSRVARGSRRGVVRAARGSAGRQFEKYAPGGGGSDRTWAALDGTASWTCRPSSPSSNHRARSTATSPRANDSFTGSC